MQVENTKERSLARLLGCTLAQANYLLSTDIDVDEIVSVFLRMDIEPDIIAVYEAGLQQLVKNTYGPKAIKDFTIEMIGGYPIIQIKNEDSYLNSIENIEAFQTIKKQLQAQSKSEIVKALTIMSEKFSLSPYSLAQISDLPKEMEDLKNFTNRHQELLNQKKKLYNNRTTIVINAFGGPGAGKTVSCMDVCQQLKKRGYNAEYVAEYCKDLVYDHSDLLDGTAKNQFHVLKEQMRRVDRLIGQVDFVVTDSPILLNSVYNKELTPEYEEMVSKLFKQYDNFTFVVKRDEKNFQKEGRIHDLQESQEKDSEITSLLEKNNLYFGTYNHDTIHKVVENAIKTFDRIRSEKETELERD